MKVTGLITEYNPFHSGHQYHMDEARRLTGADAILVVMSGDFVQRGLPAITDKYSRTRMALTAGADAVIELPLAAATGSAEYFASGAVQTLNACGCVTDLVYGCECDPPELLTPIARLLSEEPDSFRAALQENLRRGLSYPAARSLAIQKILPDFGRILDLPNNILGIEYQKALIQTGSPIRPHGLVRRGIGYHQSASSIREAAAAGSLDRMTGYLPDFVRKELTTPLLADDLMLLLLYRLRILSTEELTTYFDVSPELAARIHRGYQGTDRWDTLVQTLASRNRTRTHIQRALIHILTGLTREEARKEPTALRLLGFRKGSPLLRALKDHAQLPVVTKLADAPADAFSAEIRAADIYRLVQQACSGALFPDEYHAGPVIL